jgi:hypothetical protein
LIINAIFGFQTQRFVVPVQRQVHVIVFRGLQFDECIG